MDSLVPGFPCCAFFDFLRWNEINIILQKIEELFVNLLSKCKKLNAVVKQKQYQWSPNMRSGLVFRVLAKFKTELQNNQLIKWFYLLLRLK